MISTILHEAAVTTDGPIANLLFDYPGADIILRSQDFCHFRVPKSSIINSSPILAKEILKHLDSSESYESYSGPTNSEVSLTSSPQPQSYLQPMEKLWSSYPLPKGIKWKPH